MRSENRIMHPRSNEDRPFHAPRGEEFCDDARSGQSGAGPRASANESSRRLAAEDLAPLTRIVNWRSAAAVLQTWLTIGVTVAIALACWSWPLALGAVVIIATQQHALFILSHDAAHYRLFEHRGINDLIGRLCAAAPGLSMRTYRVIHRLHHNHLYGPQDPDIALHGGYPRGTWYLVRKLLKDLSGMTAAKTYAYFFGNPAKNTAADGPLNPLADTSIRLRVQARSDQRLVIALQLALPALMLGLGGWRALGLYLVLWVLPAVTVLQAILRLRAVCEHGAVADVSSPLTAARTHAPGFSIVWLVARAVLFPHHVNYHIEHHLYPAVPHYHLKRLHALLASRGMLQRAEVLPIGATMQKVFANAAPSRVET
jgi:fatty acid desaturase